MCFQNVFLNNLLGILAHELLVSKNVLYHFDRMHGSSSSITFLKVCLNLSVFCPFTFHIFYNNVEHVYAEPEPEDEIESLLREVLESQLGRNSHFLLLSINIYFAVAIFSSLRVNHIMIKG